MRTLVVGLATSLAAGLALAAQSASDAPNTLVKSYLEIHAHLAADRFDELKGPARTLGEQARALGKPAEAVARASAALESAADIKAARDAFGPLSDAVIAWVQSDASKGAAGELRLAYCPMVKRSWLQLDEQIRNPYYGKQMAGCGEFRPLKN